MSGLAPRSGRIHVSHPQKYLVVVGPVGDNERRAVRDASQSSGVATAFVDTPAALREYIASQEPFAILVQADAEGAFECCVQVREARLAHVPILGYSAKRDELAFGELFNWGGDDLVSLATPQPLARRLRGLVARPVKQVPPAASRQGYALVAGADPQWRALLSRMLFNAGIGVRAVGNAADAIEESRAEGVLFVVATEDLEPGGAAAALAEARTRGATTPWVLVAPPKWMATVRDAIDGQERAAVTDAFAPPENVLFVANELARPPRGHEHRASARLLYSTTIAFRLAGRDEDDAGLTYNVSKGGLYVRTLAPVEAGQEVWLELFPPRCERRVRLAGKAAWSRCFGPNESATVPAGFGVQITDGLAGDLARYQAGCDAFAEDLIGKS
jgi:Tfp pilus assembly protein PilZ/CheY-like chemotaxis protein